MGLQIGLLRHRVALQRYTSATIDALGQRVNPAWTTYATRWAAIEPISGLETDENKQVQTSVSYQIRIRGAGLAGANKPTAKDRLLLGTRQFNVDTVIDVDERHFELRLLCKESRV